MTPPIRFDGGTAVITGAASGIGSGLARHAASLGMRLVLADVDRPRLDAFAATLDADVLTVLTDVGNPDAVDALAEQAWQRYGRVDLLFNNAGVMATGFTWEISFEQFERSFAVNVHGVLNGIRSFVPRMLKAGTPAHIVNTASIGGFLPSPLMAPYSASKFAVRLQRIEFKQQVGFAHAATVTLQAKGTTAERRSRVGPWTIYSPARALTVSSSCVLSRKETWRKPD